MSPNDPICDDSTCTYCGAMLPTNANADSWAFNGYCDATCAGFDLIKRAQWADDKLHASQRSLMMAAFGSLARLARQSDGIERDLAMTQVTSELPRGALYKTYDDGVRDGIALGKK